MAVRWRIIQHLLAATSTSASAALSGAAGATAASAASAAADAFIDPASDRVFALQERVELTHNTRLYRFALPDAGRPLGLPTGQHLWLYATINGERVMRPYTPVSDDADLGHFDLVIKVYPGGKMSQHVDSLKPGDTIAVRGPKGRFAYKPNMRRAFAMVAGGTGITPMFQIIKAVLRDPTERTVLRLVYANVSESDILLRAELDALAARHDNFKVHYVLDRPPAGWHGSVGFVTGELMAAHLPAPAADVQMLLCGPAPMIKAVSRAASELGWTKDAMFAF